MLALLQFAVFTLAVFGSLGLLLMWIRRRHPRWRSPVAFVVALGAAYAASFSLDMFVGSLVEVYAFKPYVSAVFVWMGYAIGLHLLAAMVAVSTKPVWVPYILTGTLAAVVGSLGPHRYNILVGLPLVGIGLIYRRAGSRRIESGEYREGAVWRNVKPDPAYWHPRNAGFNKSNAKFVCEQCEHERELDWRCESCGGSSWVLGQGNGLPGIFCESCHEGEFVWECPNCLKRQKVLTSFYYNSSRLHIARR